MQIGWLGAFLMGLFGALHCVGMCGSIMGVLTLSLPTPIRTRPGRLAAYLFWYSSGRLLSYALAGALAGAFGAGIVGTLFPRHARLVLLLLTSGAMLAVGFHLAGWFPGLRHVEQLGAPLWQRLEPLGRRLLPVRHPFQALLYGLLWGWLPCGLVYSALFIALGQGGWLPGMIFMFLFGLGTLPAMLFTGFFAERMMRLARNPALRQWAGLALILLALSGLILNWTDTSP